MPDEPLVLGNDGRPISSQTSRTASATLIRSFSEVPLEEGDANPAELELARQLIDQVPADDFDASAFKDEVRERMLELIEQKLAGQDITAAPAHEPKSPRAHDTDHRSDGGAEGLDRRGRGPEAGSPRWQEDRRREERREAREEEGFVGLTDPPHLLA